MITVKWKAYWFWQPLRVLPHSDDPQWCHVASYTDICIWSDTKCTSNELGHHPQIGRIRRACRYYLIMHSCFSLDENHKWRHVKCQRECHYIWIKFEVISISAKTSLVSADDPLFSVMTLCRLWTVGQRQIQLDINIDKDAFVLTIMQLIQNLLSVCPIFNVVQALRARLIKIVDSFILSIQIFQVDLLIINWFADNWRRFAVSDQVKRQLMHKS